MVRKAGPSHKLMSIASFSNSGKSSGISMEFATQIIPSPISRERKKTFFPLNHCEAFHTQGRIALKNTQAQDVGEKGSLSFE